ncbi:DUF4259 domain-containing protein [Plantactinospora sp. KLBMP9567]|uniref:DUF4259 domain-containing protein n=1 Tax=Plantactinospora sp. KLBMP9567 TaxID=3085900 RepID=UPI00298212A5|nr:DUF4259 domain-containing protein [Plantactinospora sp. KLBMP9567]MDW5323798.1 DUF4259 domain-containing protein [Plantactinospora sp. KLBMP9567]
MGSWGFGNFDNDTAADHLSIITKRLLDEVTEAMAGDPVELEPDEYWGVAVPCNLELLYRLAELPYVGVCLPEPDVAADWKRRYLAVWDETIGELVESAEARESRRAVLVETFDRFLAAARHEATG